MGAKKKSVWLNYDLGLTGNYAALYSFLDNHQAIDCGNGLAYFTYENQDALSSEELIEKLKNELKEAITPSKNDSIYVIWRDDDKASSTSVKGKFLFGRRKTPVWSGYANTVEASAEEEAI